MKPTREEVLVYIEDELSETCVDYGVEPSRTVSKFLTRRATRMLELIEGLNNGLIFDNFEKKCKECHCGQPSENDKKRCKK